MHHMWTFAALLMSVASLSTLAKDSLTIAVIGKTMKDSFYEQSLHGCEQFAKSVESDAFELKCQYAGPVFFQDIREQALATEAVINSGVDGILISITDSKYLVEHALMHAQQKNIPVITFDSDVLAEHRSYRLAYVGTNNFDFGVALGQYAMQFAREGGTEFCIQSGHASTPNLDERIRGVRFALSGNNNNQRLRSKSKWHEYERCPFYTLGKRDMAVSQLELVLRKSIPVFIAVAGFAQFSPEYIERIGRYRQALENKATVIVSADTETVQLDALREKLSTANIGQRPFEMGRLGAQMLFKYLRDGTLPSQEFTYLGFHTCTPENVDVCTLNE